MQLQNSLSKARILRMAPWGHQLLAQVLGGSFMLLTIVFLVVGPPPLHEGASALLEEAPASQSWQVQNSSEHQQEELTSALRPILAAASNQFFGSAWSLGFRKGEHQLTLAAGYSDIARRVNATGSEKFKYGSQIKMFTAAAMMQLVESGELALDDLMAPLVDSFLKKVDPKKQGYAWSTMEELFGDQAGNVTLRQLLHMRSGIPEFDGEKARGIQMASPTSILDPLQALDMAGKFNMTCVPGTGSNYSSTGFVLLALVLTNHANLSHWNELDLYEFFPDWVRDKYGAKIIFYHTGPCNGIPNVAHGYTQLDVYNDVWKWSCMFGWMCGSLIADPQSMADFAYDLYGPRHALVNRSSLAQMLYFEQMENIPMGYGLGTMLNTPTASQYVTLAYGGNTTGQYDAENQLQPLGMAVGHEGEAFGFLSWTAYSTEDDYALSLTTNINQYVPPGYNLTKTPGLPGPVDIITVAFELTNQIEMTLASLNATTVHTPK